MPASLLKTIATQNKTYAQKAASPHERIIDRIKSVRVDRFEKIGAQMSVVGTDLSTGRKVRMFREWSRSPRVKETNPLEKAPETVQAGGVIMFTDIREITGLEGETTFTSDGFVTVSRNADREDAEIIHDAEAFVDAPETLENGEMVQMFNIARSDKSEMVKTPEEFFQAFKAFFENRESIEDSVVIRGYSEADGVSSAIRIYVGPSDTFRDRMTRFLEEDHYIEMAGDIEGTFEVNGRELVASLKDPQNDTIWEVIPVTGLRKRLTVRNDPDFSQRLQEKASALFQNFVHIGEGTLTGCRKVSVGLRHTSYGRGARFKDVVAAFHAPGRALPLAMIDTPHVKGLDKVFPGYGKDRLYSVDGHEPEMDFSAYIDDLAGELQNENIDFLNQPGILEIDSVDEAPAPAGDTQADAEIDLSLFDPGAPEPEGEESQSADVSSVPGEATAEDDVNSDIDFTEQAGIDATEAEPVDHDTVKSAPFTPDEGSGTDEFEIDLSEFSEEAKKVDPETETSEPEDDFDIDLANLEEPSADPTEVADDNDDPEIDLAAFADAEPEPAHAAAAADPKVADDTNAVQSDEDPSVGFVDLGDEDEDFGADDFLADPVSESVTGQEEKLDEQSLASADAPTEKPKNSAEKKSESEELIADNFDAIAGAMKF